MFRSKQPHKCWIFQLHSVRAFPSSGSFWRWFWFRSRCIWNRSGKGRSRSTNLLNFCKLLTLCKFPNGQPLTLSVLSNTHRDKSIIQVSIYILINIFQMSIVTFRKQKSTLTRRMMISFFVIIPTSFWMDKKNQNYWGIVYQRKLSFFTPTKINCLTFFLFLLFRFETKGLVQSIERNRTGSVPLNANLITHALRLKWS